MATINRFIIRVCIPINILLFFFGILIGSEEVVGLAGVSTLLLLTPKFLLNNEKQEKENK